MVKQIIIIVHTNPNTQPGGVQGALFNKTYQLDETPLPVNSPPKAKAPKFRMKNRTHLMKFMKSDLWNN
tara:strand:- start:4943 stop:5149 length:207 start_codon:yes stop_codon:yes gene_type:complete